jgi:hypothetical protein
MAVSRKEWINLIAAHVGYGMQANTPIWAIVVSCGPTPFYVCSLSRWKRIDNVLESDTSTPLSGLIDQLLCSIVSCGMTAQHRPSLGHEPGGGSRQAPLHEVSGATRRQIQ